jgi:hypothetical protein
MEYLVLNERRAEVMGAPTVEPGALVAARTAQDPPVELLQSFVAMRRGRSDARIFAFTSARRREGVTHVVRVLGRELAAYTGEDVIILNAQTLRRLRVFDIERIEEFGKTTGEGVWIVPDRDLDAKDAPIDENIWQALRARFGFVLLDCEALERSSGILTIAEKADGTVLVVASGFSAKKQIQNAARLLALSNARNVGCILNRRTYPVPKFLYKLF